jgi:hypothetical protein
MAGANDWRQPARMYHTRLLTREVAVVRPTVAEIVVITPDAETQAAMGSDAMAPGAEQAVAESARRQGRGAL